MKKQNHKTSKQLKEEIKKRQEIEEKNKAERLFIKTRIYPLLIKYSESIDDSKALLTTISIPLEQSYMNKMNDFKVSDMKLDEQVDKTNRRAQFFIDILEEIKDLPLMDGINCLNRYINEIDRLVKKEINERSFDTLKMEWIDEEVN